jgi:hypothetical protein
MKRETTRQDQCVREVEVMEEDDATASKSAAAGSAAGDYGGTQSPPTVRGFRRCRARKRVGGGRCRLPAKPGTEFCFRHTWEADTAAFVVPEEKDLSEHFGECLKHLDHLESACDLNSIMTILAKLVIKNEISARRAAVLAYIVSQLLRTLPEIEKECPPRIIFDYPRPKSDEQIERESILKDETLSAAEKVERLKALEKIAA